MPVTKLPKNPLVEAIRGTAQRMQQPTDDNVLKAQLLGFLGKILEDQIPTEAEQIMPMPAAMAVKLPFASRLLRATKPPVSIEQLAVTDALQSLRSPLPLQNVAPAHPLREAALTEAAFRDIRQPHNRRGFFKNILGIPHRMDQVKAAIMNDDREAAAALEEMKNPMEFERFFSSAEEERLANAAEALQQQVINRGKSPFDKITHDLYWGGEGPDAPVNNPLKIFTALDSVRNPAQPPTPDVGPPQPELLATLQQKLRERFGRKR